MEMLKKRLKEKNKSLTDYRISFFTGTDHRGFNGTFCREEWEGEDGSLITYLTFLEEE